MKLKLMHETYGIENNIVACTTFDILQLKLIG